MKRALPRLHVVTADHIAARADLAPRARAIAAAGVVALHARARLDGRGFVALAEALALSGAPVIVNDRADVARAIGAAGLHLPAYGLPIRAARRLVGDRWLGRSTHSPEEADRAAAEGADYVFLGPIWTTASHPDRAPLGLDAIRAATARVIAIGGVTPERVADCIAAGAYGVAVISAIWDAPDPGSAVGQMMVDLE